MNRKRYEFSVSMAVRSPFLFRGLASGLFGLDTVPLRDEQGNPLIPQDQVRGVLREAMDDLASATGGGIADAALVEALFGTGTAEGEGGEADNQPDRGLLVFSDLTARQMRREDGAELEAILLEHARDYTRVEIDNETGAARTGHLFVCELAIPPGAVALFEGKVTAWLSEDEAGKVETALDRALGLVATIGGMKSPGFGEVVSEGTDIRKSAGPVALPAAANVSPNDWHAFKLTFDRPYLVDAARVAGNAFLGAAVVPGAVIKGALARALGLSGALPASPGLAEALSQLRISHAWPLDANGQRLGRAVPLSLVSAKAPDDSVLFGDALVCPQGKGTMLKGKPGVFCPDWKPEVFTQALKGILSRSTDDLPAPLSRTHTAIKGNVAEDQKLFTHIARSHLREPANDARWTFDLCVDTSGVADKSLAALLLGALEGGLDNIGKTGAQATLKRDDAHIPKAKPVHGQSYRFAVVLETPAFLFDPRDQRPLHDLYASYWASACPGATLVDFFASQTLAGGYLGHRRRAFGDNVIYPFVLTQPGSVFLLEGDIGKALDGLLRTGLPVTKMVDDRELSWVNCPYMPENGYGEISVDYLADAGIASKLAEMTHV